MKEKIMAFLAVALALVVGLAIAEMIFRVALPPVPGDEGSVYEYMTTSQRNPGAPRLFPAGYSALFDVKGLYESGNEVAFRVGPKRFIEPEPKGEAPYKVLFLGGSVTEGIFIRDNERWPGRLNEEGRIAAYNASMSAAGMLAQYLTAKYLSERGDKFDLVVLATNHNDSTWSRRFVDVDSRYRLENYSENLKKVLEKEFVVQRQPDLIPLRTFAWARHLIRVAQMKASNADVAAAAKAGDDAKDPSFVVHALRQLQNGSQKLPKTKLTDCTDPVPPQKVTALAYEDWKENLPAFKREMKRLLGAELLVVSEPVAYGAPPSSFYFTDMRVFPTCTTRDGLRAIETDDIIAFERERATAYLDAAKMAGAATFDLAAAMDPLSNGPEGGKLFFDSIHPTPKGAEKFAEFLRPAIRQALENSKKD
jgi:lysophospholipase L1-like esterase